MNEQNIELSNSKVLRKIFRAKGNQKPDPFCFMYTVKLSAVSNSMQFELDLF